MYSTGYVYSPSLRWYADRPSVHDSSQKAFPCISEGRSSEVLFQNLMSGLFESFHFLPRSSSISASLAFRRSSTCVKPAAGLHAHLTV
jgi:hypothetical protein